MDDEPDGLYNWAPELEDLVGLCRALNREGVRYLLIGGFAVILHGFVRTTKDVDVLLDPSGRQCPRGQARASGVDGQRRRRHCPVRRTRAHSCPRC